MKYSKTKKRSRSGKVLGIKLNKWHKISLFSLLVVAVVVSGFFALKVKHTNAAAANVGTARGVIAFVGDSNIVQDGKNLTYFLTSAIPGHFNYPYTPVLLARFGAGIRTADCANTFFCTTFDFWKARLPQAWLNIKPNAVVVNLGINDTYTLGTATTRGYSYYGAKINYLMNLMPAGIPIFWTNLPCKIEPVTVLAGCNYVNSSLKAAVSRWPNLKVLDWATVANTHPDYLYPVGTGVHYSEDGYNAWNTVVVNALDAQFPLN